jgi:hypothetical protein
LARIQVGLQIDFLNVFYCRRGLMLGSGGRVSVGFIFDFANQILGLGGCEGKCVLKI